MRNRLLAALICAAVITAAGCGSQAGGNNSTGRATESEKDSGAQDGNAETGEQGSGTVESDSDGSGAGKTAAGAGMTSESAVQQEPAAPKGEKYVSEDGWSVYYDDELVEVSEGTDLVEFVYTGECSGTNKIGIRYIPNTATDIVLAEKYMDEDDDESPKIERSEGYFGGRTDIWSFSVDELRSGNSTHGYTAVEHNRGVLLIERTGYKEADEELGTQIADTMSSILSSFEFEKHAPQTEYDYIPGKYELNAEGVRGSAEGFPAEILLREDHTGTFTMQSTAAAEGAAGGKDKTDKDKTGKDKNASDKDAPAENGTDAEASADQRNIIWYSRDKIIKEDAVGGKSYYFSMEGDILYLEQGEEYAEYQRDTSISASAEAASTGESTDPLHNKSLLDFKTYESEDGWMVYYDQNLIYGNEANGTTGFVYGGSAGGTEMLTFTYHPYDTTDEVLEDIEDSYNRSQIESSEGFVGGNHGAWGYTIKVPSVEGTSGMGQIFTAIEHNGGTLLIERVFHASGDSDEARKVEEAFEEILSTFMFTAHEPEREYRDIPGTYQINDKKLAKSASSYPGTTLVLNENHTGKFTGFDKEVDLIWHSRDGIIREPGVNGTSYTYRIEDDTLYLQMGNEQVEFIRDEREDDDWDDWD